MRVNNREVLKQYNIILCVMVMWQYLSGKYPFKLDETGPVKAVGLRWSAGHLTDTGLGVFPGNQRQEMTSSLSISPVALGTTAVSVSPS